MPPAIADDDPRMDYIFDYLSRSLRIKLEKWQKLLGNEEMKVHLSPKL